jgi:recombination protein RecT
MAQAVETKAPHPLVRLRHDLELRESELKAALPVHISPDRFIRVVLTAAQINPDILACARQSLWNACLRAANDGLLPDGVEGAIVPYKDRATWIPMYQGLLKKFRNSGEFKWVTAGIVYEGDEYSHWIDETGEHFRHVPQDDNADKKIRRIYALATTKDGGSFITDMSLADVNKRKNMSRGTRDDAPWKVWPEEMMKKTAIRQLSKYLPKSSDIDALLRRDDEDLLGVESIEDRRQERKAQAAGAMDALRQFGGEAESDGGSEDVGEEIKQSADDAGADKSADAGSTQQEAKPPTKEAVQPTSPKTPEAYFAYAESMTQEMISNSQGEVDPARKWFNSEAQRKMRKAIGVEVDAVVTFSERVFGK